MDINGAQNLSPQELAAEIQRGARVLQFSWCVSVIFMTFRRYSVVLVRPGESTFVAGLPYTGLSLAFGWWGFPFGLIFTPIAVVQNLSGGRDLTRQVAATLPSGSAYGAPSLPSGAPSQPMVYVMAPDGQQYPAQVLARQNGSTLVRFSDGRQDWVPDHVVRG